MNTIVSLPSHTWTVLLQKQEPDPEQKQQLQEEEQYPFRVMLCSINTQTRYILANIFKNLFFFNFLWRTFLILYGEGFIRNGTINIGLFEQLFWIITTAFITTAYFVFPGKMLVTGIFSEQSPIGVCLLLPIDEQISRDSLKLHGVALASSFNMIIFVIYLFWKSERVLKSKTSLIGRFRRNAIDYKESAAISVAWSAFNIWEIVLVYVCRYLICSPFSHFWTDRFMWVFLLEMVSLALTCMISFREIPFENVPIKNIPFYVNSPLVLIPRRPPEPLTPLLLASARSRSRTPPRSRGKGTNKIRGIPQPISSQDTHQRSSQNTSALPDVQ